MLAQLRPIDRAITRHKDKDVVVFSSTNHDRLQDGPYREASQLRGVLDAFGATGANDGVFEGSFREMRQGRRATDRFGFLHGGVPFKSQRGYMADAPPI